MIAVVVLGVPQAGAATERYDYDPAGRLARRIDGDQQATQFQYDAAGNLLSVENAGVAQPPIISSWNPTGVPRNSLRWIDVTGSGLAYAAVRSPDPGITVSDVVSSANSLTLRVGVTASVPLGPHTLVVESTSGKTSLTIDVLPEAPVQLDPQPISLPPDNVFRAFSVRIAEPLSRDLHFSLSVSPSTVSRLKETQLVLPAGQQQLSFGLAGTVDGTAVLTLRSDAMLESANYLIAVSPDFASGSARHSLPLNLVRGQPFLSSDGQVGPVSSTALKLQRGPEFIGSSAQSPLISPELRLFRPSSM